MIIYSWIIRYGVQGNWTQEIKHYHQKSVYISPLCFPVLASSSDSLSLHGRFLQVRSTLALLKSMKKKFLLPCAYSRYPRICLLWLDHIKLWKYPQTHGHLGGDALSDCPGLVHGFTQEPGRRRSQVHPNVIDWAWRKGNPLRENSGAIITIKRNE